MFKNMKLGTKLALGFGLMVALMIALGGTGYVMFNRVDSDVGELTGHYMPGVKHSTGVERSAFECVVEEKNYVLYEQDETHQQAKEKMVALMSNLDEVDKVAQQYNDTALGQKAREIRTVSEQFSQMFEKGVAALKNNESAAAAMDTKGNLVGNEANAYVTAKEAEYREAKSALAVVNRVNALALETRVAEKACMLHEEQDYFDRMFGLIEKNIAGLLEGYDQLAKLHPDTAEQELIDDARKATQQYSTAAQAWVKEHKRDAESAKLAELATTLDETGEIVTKAAGDYLKHKEAQTNMVADAVFIVSAIGQGALTTRLNEKAYIASQEEQYWKGLNQHLTALDGLYDDLRKVSLTDEDKQRIDRADKATEEYLAAAKDWVANDDELQKTILPQMNHIGQQIVAAAQSAGNDAWVASDESTNSVTGIVASSKFIIMISLAIGVVAGFVAAFVVTRGITKPINRIIDNLNEGATQVTEAAGQVSTTSQQLAEGASEQASSLEETSSALEEMAAMTRTNAENAKQANDLSDQARRAADTGDQTMGRLNDAMKAINESSGQISKIIKAIEEIAFQTNLLALNAAVEAARAGEHGKGFAVVAEEVRNLAQRSATAASETTDLIEGSVQRAKEGTQVAGEVGQALSKIVADVTKVTELINGIARASAEQAQGVEQVNTAVAEMDKVTQTNAAGAEESASASEQLSAQAVAVNSVVGELAMLVGGSANDQRTTAGPTNAAVKPQRKHYNVKVARIHKHEQKKPQPAGAHSESTDGGTAASDEHGDLKDF